MSEAAIASEVVSGITKVALEELVKPILKKGFAGLRAISTAILDVFVDRFRVYLEQQVQRHYYLSTIVFGNQKSLESLYIPLTACKALRAERGSREGKRIDSFRMDFLPKEERVLITDTAGMGKSTLLKFLFLQCVKTGYAIPIFVELRHLSQKTSLLQIVEDQLNPSSAPDADIYFSRKRIERLFTKGGFVFFFDGYDEISFKEREFVTRDMKNFIEKYSNNLFAITSRPETGLLAFPSFMQFTIKPLETKESFELIQKYDQGAGRAEQLIAMLRGKDLRAVAEFLKNPLLTTLLYRSFEYKQHLPLKKPVFYRQVFDALFDWHDSTKDGYNTREKKSRLDIDSFHRVLRVVGFISVMKGQIEGEMDEVLSWFRTAKRICAGLNFGETDLLDDLIRAVPIFVKDGSYYRWSHKSLAEYFAAQYICTEGKVEQERIFRQLFESEQLQRFSNVLDQIYDVDKAAFRKYFTLPVAKAFSEYWARSYRGLDPKIPAEDVALRKSVTFGFRYLISQNDAIKGFRKIDELTEAFLKADGGNRLKTHGTFNKVMFFQSGRSQGSDAYHVVVTLAGPFGVVLDILASKKDPVMYNVAKLERKPLETQGIGKLKQLTEITDDPGSQFNKLRTFSAVTDILIGTSDSVVDAAQMLGFEASFEDTDRLSALTDQLLSELSRDPTGSS